MRSTAMFALAVMIGLAAVVPQTLTAQNEKTDGQKSKAKEYRGPLPFYFGKLGLSEPQKETLYAIQDSYDQKIAPLREQIKRLQNERDKSMQALLTPGQNLRLKELREEALVKEKQAEQVKVNADAGGGAKP